MIRVLAATAALLAVAACATPQTDALRNDIGGLPRAAQVADTPFFSQRTRECGPAALAMILVKSGVPVDPDRLVDEVYNPGRGGSLAPAVLAAARRAGRIAYPVTDLRTLLAEIRGGRPVLVLQNLGLEWLPRWHYAVAVGYDLDRGSMILHSGKTASLEMPLTTFERTWRRGDYWGLTVLRADEIPDAADGISYATAVAGVERAGHTLLAMRAYENAVRRWPENLIAGHGLGNTRYAAGDHAGAASAFRAVTRHHPGNADAFNNLAHVLSELGRYDEAETAARRAISLGGSNIDIYRQTLAAIDRGRSTAK